MFPRRVVLEVFRRVRLLELKQMPAFSVSFVIHRKKDVIEFSCHSCQSSPDPFKLNKGDQKLDDVIS